MVGPSSSCGRSGSFGRKRGGFPAYVCRCGQCRPASKGRLMEEQSAKHRLTTRRPCMVSCAALVVVLMAVVSSGCFSHFGLPWKSKTAASDKTESDKSEASSSDPAAMEPPKEEAKADSTESSPTPSATTTEPATKEGTSPSEEPPSQGAPGPSAPTPVAPVPTEMESIDPDVRKAALEKAAGLSAVEYMKICRSTDPDQWWVTLYDNIGPFIDVKLHEWKKESRRLQRVLALKQVMHSKLEAELRKSGGDGRCEVFYRPRGESSLFAWKPVDPSKGRITARAVPRTTVAGIPAPAPPVSERRRESAAPAAVEKRSPPPSSKPRPKEKREAARRPDTSRPVLTSPPVIAGTRETREARRTPGAGHRGNRVRAGREEEPDKTVLNFLRNWKAAWEEKDFGRFRGLYHPDFKADSLNYADYLKRKRYFFNRYQYIRVEIDKIRMKRAGNLLEVTFSQDFRSDDYTDKGVKNMVLDVSRPKKVRILSETWSPR